MDRDGALRQLKGMRQDKMRDHEYWRTSKRRRLRPSERAMTLAALQMDIDAIDIAIKCITAVEELTPKKEIV